MNLVEAYKQLLKNIQHTLKEHGYTRKAGIFYKKFKDNWGIIGFQKSRSSSNEFGIKFTINFGVYSEAVAELLDPARVKSKPGIWDSQWGQRIGYLLPCDDDKWWILDEKTSIESLEKEIQDCLLYKAIPEIDKYILNDHLLDFWVMNQLPETGKLYIQNQCSSPGYIDRLNLLREKQS